MTTSEAPERVAALPVHKRVAAEIRAYTARYQITQEQLAPVLNISQQSMSRRLNGHTPFTLDELGVLAAYFHVHPAELLGGSPRGPNPNGGQGLPRLDSNQEPAGYRRLELVHDLAA